jgi:hypothetical protein
MPTSRDAYRASLFDKRPALFSLQDGNPKQHHVKSQQIRHRDEQSIPQIRVPNDAPKNRPKFMRVIPAFEYAYPVLPPSVITRFIVCMNQKIDIGFVWHTGVVLKIGENKPLVKADIEDRKITIAIDGVEHTRRDALSAIRFELGEIHNSIKGLNPQQRVPIPNTNV